MHGVHKPFPPGASPTPSNQDDELEVRAWIGRHFDALLESIDKLGHHPGASISIRIGAVEAVLRVPSNSTSAPGAESTPVPGRGHAWRDAELEALAKSTTFLPNESMDDRALAVEAYRLHAAGHSEEQIGQRLGLSNLKAALRVAKVAVNLALRLYAEAVEVRHG